MRRTAAVVVAVLAAGLVGLILGEYEMQGVVPLAAGVVVGLLLSEAVVAIGDWRGLIPAAVAAVAGAGCLLLAGWIDSTQGVEPYPGMASVGAVAAALTGALRAVRRPASGGGVRSDAR